MKPGSQLTSCWGEARVRLVAAADPAAPGLWGHLGRVKGCLRAPDVCSWQGRRAHLHHRWWRISLQVWGGTAVVWCSQPNLELKLLRDDGRHCLQKDTAEDVLPQATQNVASGPAKRLFQSVLCICISVVQLCYQTRQLQAVAFRSAKEILIDLPSIQDLHQSRVRKRAINISADPSHPRHKTFRLLSPWQEMKSNSAKQQDTKTVSSLWLSEYWTINLPPITHLHKMCLDCSSCLPIC